MSDEKCTLHELQPNQNELSKLLDSWQLSHLYNYFLEQKMTINKLRKLKAHHIKKLFTDITVGDQVQFEDCLLRWDSKVQVNDAQNFNIQLDHPTKFSLKSMLEKCANGVFLQQYYHTNGKFTENQRSLLINSLATYIYTNKLSFSLTDCAQLEKQIITLFPAEKLEYYTNGKRGRLYNKLSNLRRSPKDNSIEEPLFGTYEIAFTPEDNGEEIVALMRSKGISADERERLWKKCCKYRFDKISRSKSTEEIFHDWPEYKQIYGFQFVTLDFELKFQSGHSLIKDWPYKKHSIVTYLREKITNANASNLLSRLNNLREDSKNLIILWALHFLLCPTPMVIKGKNGEKIRKKFTTSDSQDAFAIIETSMNQLQTKLKFLEMKAEPMQPRILIVGEMTDIKEIYVHFDKVKYTFLTVIQAADALFKLFFIFNLKYPDEAVIFYKFVESFFFEMKTSNIAKVESMISDLKAQK